MKAEPQLIPSDDLGLDGDLIVVGRETALASGFIDLLCLARSGDLVLIEFKTGPQNPDFRHALAQLIDYGSDLWRMSVDDFDRGVVQRYLASARADRHTAGAFNLDEVLDRSGWNLTEEERGASLQRLSDVLSTGDFHYVVAAQRFTSAMQVSLEYMNATMRHGRFYLIEIVQLAGGELIAHAAQVVAAPPKKTAIGATGLISQTDESAFLNGIVDDSYRDAMRDILAGCAALGFDVKWGSRGASIRIATPDRREPLSIGWVLPEGSQWFGARHASFGVDRDTLALVPSVKEPVDRFVLAVRGIAGGAPVASKLDAICFNPHVLPDVVPEVLETLQKLVTDTNAPEED